MNRPPWDAYFLSIAKVVATRSPDQETQVGSVIVDVNRHIIGTGFNGYPSGADDNSLPNTRPDKYPFMVHAEINALMHATQSVRGSTLYCTHSPCHECSKALLAAGIQHVIFEKMYDGKAIDFLKQFGIKVTQIAN